MSDIGIHFEGIIAAAIFLLSAAALAICGAISLFIAFIRKSGTAASIRRQRAFSFCLASVPLIILNLAGFGIMFYCIDSNTQSVNDILDKAALFGWLPLQVIIWIGGGLLLQKLTRE
jgi:hypothetical protein